MHSHNLKFPYDVWEKKKSENPNFNPYNETQSDYIVDYADFAANISLKELPLEDNKSEILENDQPEIHETQSKNEFSRKAILAAKFAFALGGLGAGVLYLGPGQKCADIDICGKWLVDLTNSRNFAVGVFTGTGAIDFSAGAAFMAVESVDKTIHYINKQSSLGAKIGKGSGILLFALSQNTPLLAMLLRTAELWEIPLSFFGALPGSVYGAIHLTEDELPYYFSQLKKNFDIAYHHIFRIFSLPTEDEKLKWKRMTRARKNIANILKQLEAKWQYILENTDNLIVDGRNIVLNNKTITNLGKLIRLKDGTTINADYVSFLSNISKNDEIHPSLLSRATHVFSTVIGLGLALNFNAGPLSNTFSLLKNYLGGLPNIASLSLSGIGTAFFSASSLYAGARLTISGTSTILDTMINLLQGKSIGSLIYRLRPKTTTLITTLSLSAAFSYSVISLLYLHEFKPGALNNQNNLSNSTMTPNNLDKLILDKLIDVFYFSALVGMDIYHFASFLHLFELITNFVSKLTHNEKEQFLFALENSIDDFKHMTEEKWLELLNKENREFFDGFEVEDDSEEENILTTHQETSLLSESDGNEQILMETTESDDELTIEAPIITKAPNNPAKKSSLFGWSNLFSCCKKDEAYYDGDSDEEYSERREETQSLLSRGQSSLLSRERASLI